MLECYKLRFIDKMNFMKIIFLIVCFNLINIHAFSKHNYVDSLFNELKSPDNDSVQFDAATDILIAFNSMPSDSIIFYSEKLMEKSTELKSFTLKILSYSGKSYGLFRLTLYADALESGLKALELAERLGNKRLLSIVYQYLGLLYQTDDSKGLYYFFKALESNTTIEHKERPLILTNIAYVYFFKGNLDSALIYAQRSFEILNRKSDVWDKTFIQLAMSFTTSNLSSIHLGLGNRELALTYARMAVEYSSTFRNLLNLLSFRALADIYNKTGPPDSALKINKILMSFSLNQEVGSRLYPSYTLYNYYKKRNEKDSALKYLEIYTIAKNNIDSSMKIIHMQNMTFREELRQNELLNQNQKAQEERRHNLQYIGIIVGLIVFIILFFLLGRSIVVKTGFIRFWCTGTVGLF